jgi:uncharacterized protein (TIGR02147 family)
MVAVFRRIHVLAQEALQQALLKQFNELKLKNRGFSLRAYARRLGLSSGALSGVLSGKRRISEKASEKLISKMALDPKQSMQIRSLYRGQRERRQSDKSKLQLQSDQFHVISDGLHFALLSLMETHDFKPDVNWMAARLRSSPRAIEEALSRLERLGLIAVSKAGRIKLTGGHYQTSDEIADTAIQKFHEERLDEAKEALHTVDVMDRDFTSLTLAVRKDQLAAAKLMIREFKRRLEAVLEQDPKDEVYRFCIQLFPVTMTGRKGDK